MLKFPDRIKIKILENSTLKPIKVSNIIINIHAFSMAKNDYFLGPFFSNENGELEISKNMLEILAEAELETGIMDYKGIEECSPLVEIRILSLDEIANLLKGRELWGLIAREKELFITKEKLLNKIKNNNNHFVLPQVLRIVWNEYIDSEIIYEIKTSLINL